MQDRRAPLVGVDRVRSHIRCAAQPCCVRPASHALAWALSARGALVASEQRRSVTPARACTRRRTASRSGTARSGAFSASAPPGGFESSAGVRVGLQAVAASSRRLHGAPSGLALPPARASGSLVPRVRSASLRGSSARGADTQGVRRRSAGAGSCAKNSRRPPAREGAPPPTQSLLLLARRRARMPPSVPGPMRRRASQGARSAEL